MKEQEHSHKATERVFPTFVPNKYGGEGLTKRELFAAMAMQPLIPIGPARFSDPSAAHIANSSVYYADALIAELEKK